MGLAVTKWGASNNTLSLRHWRTGLKHPAMLMCGRNGVW